MPTITLNDFGKGVNKDLLPAELGPGVWSDATNFRFRNGFAEKVGGIASAFNTPSATPYWLTLFPTAANRFLVRAGTAKVFVDDGTTATEITRYADPMIGNNGSFRSAGVVRIRTDTAHGLTAGVLIDVRSIAYPSVNVDGAAVTTIIDSLNFEYADAGSFISNLEGIAFRRTTGVTTDFTGGVDDRWTGASLNGVLIMNNPVNGLFAWNGSASSRMTRLYTSSSDFTPIGYIADASRVFKNYIIQMGVTVSGTKFPYRVAWSNAAEPGSTPTSFTASSTNDAGDVDLAETPGYLVDSLPLGDVNIIYKQDARHAQQYIGGNDVFRFSRLPGTDGLLARGCVVDTPLGHVFLTTSKDVKIHMGGEARSLVVGRIQSFLASDIDSTYASRSFLTVNPTKSEVWVCYPATGQTTCSKAAIWNWESDTWSFRSLSGVTYGAAGLVPTSIATDARLIVSTSGPALGLVDSGSQDFGAAVTGTLERVGLHFDDRDQFKTLHRSRWNIDTAAASTATISHGSAKTADGTVTYATGVTYTVGTTDYVDARATKGLFCAIKLVTTANAPFSVRSADLDVTAGGKR